MLGLGLDLHFRVRVRLKLRLRVRVKGRFQVFRVGGRVSDSDSARGRVGGSALGLGLGV